MHKIKSPAKLNLFLHIVGRNKRDYHEIESLMIFLNLYDEITIEEENDISVNFTYNKKILFPTIDEKNNSITKVISIFSKIIEEPINLKVSIHKNIPVGSGLGGGSSNTSAIIKFLQRHYLHKLTKKQEIDLALSIGCDTVACLNQNPIFVEGIGEIITPCNIDKTLQNSYILIVYPQVVSLSTDSYKEFKSQNLNFSEKIKLPKVISFDFMKQQSNFLTKPTTFLHKKIQELNLYMLKYNESKNLIARMSGSGSTFFVLSPNLHEVEDVQKELKAVFPNYYYSLTRTIY